MLSLISVLHIANAFTVVRNLFRKKKWSARGVLVVKKKISYDADDTMLLNL